MDVDIVRLLLNSNMSVCVSSLLYSLSLEFCPGHLVVYIKFYYRNS